MTYWEKFHISNSYYLQHWTTQLKKLRLFVEKYNKYNEVANVLIDLRHQYWIIYKSLIQILLLCYFLKNYKGNKNNIVTDLDSDNFHLDFIWFSAFLSVKYKSAGSFVRIWNCILLFLSKLQFKLRFTITTFQLVVKPTQPSKTSSTDTFRPELYLVTCKKRLAFWCVAFKWPS